MLEKLFDGILPAIRKMEGRKIAVFREKAFAEKDHMESMSYTPEEAVALAGRIGNEMGRDFAAFNLFVKHGDDNRINMNGLYLAGNGEFSVVAKRTTTDGDCRHFNVGMDEMLSVDNAWIARADEQGYEIRTDIDGTKFRIVLCADAKYADPWNGITLVPSRGLPERAIDQIMWGDSVWSISKKEGIYVVNSRFLSADYAICIMQNNGIREGAYLGGRDTISTAEHFRNCGYECFQPLDSDILSLIEKKWHIRVDSIEF